MVLMQGFSVVICCYNSVPRIRETLIHIFNLDFIDIDLFEIIVVNNNSSDNTKEFVLALEKEFNIKRFAFEIIDEPNPGLSNARIAGISVSAFDNICFCDDDNHLRSDYLSRASIILGDSTIGIVGGLALPEFSVKVGEWAKDFYAAMAIGQQASKDGYVKGGVYGAGMVIRKRIYTELKSQGIKLLLSDRVGKVLTSGGDSEICMLATFLNYKIYYCSDMVLYHAIPVDRLKKIHYLRAKYTTIYPSVYLNILACVIENNACKANNIFKDQLSDSLKKLIYFTPRILIGKHKFYSLFSFYRTSQYLCWCLMNKRRFFDTYLMIHRNLKLVNI